MKLNVSKYLALFLLIFLGSSVLAQTMIDPVIGAHQNSASNMIFQVSYPNCKNLAVPVEVYLKINGVYHYQGVVFSTASGQAAGNALLDFAKPIEPLDKFTEIKLNAYKAKSDCSGTFYTNSTVDNPSNYVVSIKTPSTNSYSFGHEFPKQEILYLENDGLSVGFDRRTGAIYELYNKKAHGYKKYNSIQPNVGAAFQMAIHYGGLGSLGAGCGGQGYWNPTQAGASCSYFDVPNVTSYYPTFSQSNAFVYCNGVLTANGVCERGTSAYELRNLKMFSFDYTSSYRGPYNQDDTMVINQKHVVTKYSLESTAFIKDLGVHNTYRTASEFPAMYLQRRFRNFRYSENGAVSPLIKIPQEVTGASSKYYKNEISLSNKNFDWISFSQDDNKISPEVWTVGIALDKCTLDATEKFTIGLYESETFKIIKFNYIAGGFLISPNQLYQIKYIVFPMSPETIINDNKYGAITVTQAIKNFKSLYQGKSCSNSLPMVTGPLVNELIPSWKSLSTIHVNSELWSKFALTDNNPTSCYSSYQVATGTVSNESIAAWFSQVQDINLINMKARMHLGSPLGFPRKYSVYVTSSDNTRWVFVGSYTNQPDSNGNVTIQFPQSYRTHGVYILPSELGADESNDRYLQMCELEVGSL